MGKEGTGRGGFYGKKMTKEKKKGGGKKPW